MLTQDETKQAGADTSRKEDSSQSNAGSTSQDTKTFTESVQKLVSDKLAAAGREAKSLEIRKAELERREQEIAQWRARKDEEELEEARGDPDKLSQFQKGKALREREAAVAKKEREVEENRLAHEVEIEEARATKREIDIFDIAQEYEGGDAVKLKKLSDTFKATSKEQLREAAETIWEKKGKQPDGTPKLKHDSGMTIGGVTNTDDLSPREKIEKGLEKERGK